MAATSQFLTRFSPRQTVSELFKQFPPGRLGAFIVFVTLAAASLLYYAFLDLPVQAPTILAILYVLTILAEWAPIKLTGTPLQGNTLSVSAALAYAALLMFGPSAAILVNTGSAFAFWTREKRPFYKRLFTAATYVTSSGVAGAVYILCGGGVPFSLTGIDLGAAILASVTYFFTNAMLVSGAIGLQTKRSFVSVFSSWQALFLQMFACFGIGLVMAAAYSNGLGLQGMAISGTLLILPWYSAYFYARKSRQVIEQTEKLERANTELEQVNRSLDLRLETLRALHSISMSLTSAQSLDQILRQVLVAVVKLTSAETSAVFLRQSNEELTIAGHVGLSADYMAHPDLALDGSAARALREGRAVVMDQRDYRPEMLSAVAEKEGIRSAASLPLSLSGKVVGALDVGFKRDHNFGQEEMDLLRSLAEQAAIAVQNAHLVEQIHEGYLSTIRALAATVEAKDPYTRGHSEIVRQLAIATGRQLGLPAHQIELLNLGALFHDIGKIGISEVILNKFEHLTEQEWAEMRMHPVVGEHILSKVPALSGVLPIVRHHHERFDGMGYPDGISAREQMLAAIISVCDAYQAMISDRPYRKALAHTQALDEIRRCSGTHFVPEIVEAFIGAAEYPGVRQPRGVQLNPELVFRYPVLVDAPHLEGL